MVKRLLAASLLAMTACTFPEQPLPPGERQYVVHAILDPSQRYQIVHLSLTEGSTPVAREFDEAEVSITAPDGNRLIARQDSSRDTTGKAFAALPQYRVDLQASSATLAPGGTYSLRIALRGGDVITGETRIPVAEPVAMPDLEDFIKSTDTLRLAWPRIDGARTYEVQVWWVQMYTYYGTYTYTRLRYSAFVDTSLTLGGTAKTWTNDDIFELPYGRNEDIKTRVQVFAVDDNYYEYYRLLGDPFIGAAPTRIQGGLGVFGSVVPVAQRQLRVK